MSASAFPADSDAVGEFAGQLVALLRQERLWLTPSEFARRHGVSTRTVERWLSSGAIPPGATNLQSGKARRYWSLFDPHRGAYCLGCRPPRQGGR